MSSHLVSIIIPVFNGAAFVREAIASALAQSWPDTEVIVVNDGSDDGGATKRILTGFGDAIRVIHQENAGVGTALNTGVAAMRGDWFSWLSHDDLYHRDRIAHHMARLKSQPGDMISFGDVDQMDQDGRFIGSVHHTRGFPADGHVEHGLWAVLEGRLNGCAMTLPRRLIEAAGGFDPALPTTQDYDLWFRLALKHPFLPVPGAHVRQRIHGGQGSHTQRHLEEASLLFVNMLEHLDRLGGTARQHLANLRRAQGALQHAPYLGARYFLADRLAAALSAFRANVVVRRPPSTRHVGQALDLLRTCGIGVESIITTTESPSAEPDVEAGMEADTDLSVDLSLDLGHAPQPEALVRAGLAVARHDLVVILDALDLPSQEMLSAAIASVAGGEKTAWVSSQAMILDRASAQAWCAKTGPRTGAQTPLAGFEGASDLRQFPVPVPLPRFQLRSDAVPSSAAETRKTAERLHRMPLSGRPTLLFMLHPWGGGTHRLARIIANALGARANILYGWGSEDRTFHLGSIRPLDSEMQWDVREEGLEAPIRALKALGVTRVDVFHTIGFDDHIELFLDLLGVPFDVTLCDYHHLALQPHLMDDDWRHVGDAILDDPAHPLRRPGPPRLLLRAAERRIACSRDLAWRAGRMMGGLPVLAVQVPEPVVTRRFPIQAPPLEPSQTLRILYLGGLFPHKGSETVIALARLMEASGFNGHIYCLGEHGPDMAPELRHLTSITLLGAYDQQMLNPLVCKLRPHLAWLPFRAPETYSFSVSDCIAQGLPLLTTGIGAIPERLEGRPATWLLPPPADAAQALAWLQRLAADALRTPPVWFPTDHLPPLLTNFYESDYLRP